MKFVALGHYSRTGKDTFANYLGQHLKRLCPSFNYAKVPLAWKLKQIAHDLYAWDGMRAPEFYDTVEGQPFRDIPLPTIGKTPVEIWIDLGTPAVRQNVYDRTWLDYLTKTDHGVDLLAVPDVRFPNEFDAFWNAGGLMIQVVRPGYGPRNSVADRALLGEDRWHYVVGGTGELSELEEWALQVAQHFAFGEPLPLQTQEEREWQLSQQKNEPWTPDPVRHISPNGAQPGSVEYDAEIDWLAAGFMPVPAAREHPVIYRAMLNQFGNVSHQRKARHHCSPAARVTQ